MTARLGVREIVRNFRILEDYDYVEIEDKKTHGIKGLFVSPKLLDEVKQFLDDGLKAKRQKEIDEIMQFVGIADGEFGDMDAKEIRALKRQKYL